MRVRHRKRVAKTVDQLVAEARAGLVRMTPVQAAAAMRGGALLIDTRSVEQRRQQGAIPGAVSVERTVLEWRLDPASPQRITGVRDHDHRVIVLCSEGYSSSLAAASLQRLGLRNATDVVGGFAAWVAAGLPVTPGEV